MTDSSYNIVNLQFPKRLQGMTNNVGVRFSVDDTTPLLITCCVNSDRVSLQLEYQPPLINNTKT